MNFTLPPSEFLTWKSELSMPYRTQLTSDKSNLYHFVEHQFEPVPTLVVHIHLNPLHNIFLFFQELQEDIFELDTHMSKKCLAYHWGFKSCIAYSTHSLSHEESTWWKVKRINEFYHATKWIPHVRDCELSIPYKTQLTSNKSNIFLAHVPEFEDILLQFLEEGKHVMEGIQVYVHK